MADSLRPVVGAMSMADGTPIEASAGIRDHGPVRTLIGMPTLTYVPPGAARTTPPMATPLAGDEMPPYDQGAHAAPAATGGALTTWAPRPLRRKHEAAPVEVNVQRHLLPDPPDPRLVMLRDSGDGRAASFRALRHRLGERGDPRAVLVTSAEAGEGKSFVAANLALALAELHRFKVLLVELAPKHPTLADLFGLTSDKYTSVLDQIQRHREQPDAPWQMVSIAPHDLHVLPIAPRAEGAPHLEAPALHAALGRLRATYDYVIVDGPPTLGGPIVNFAEDAVEGLVLVARRQQSRARALKKAIEQISPSELLGVVLVEG